MAKLAEHRPVAVAGDRVPRAVCRGTVASRQETSSPNLRFCY
jgi:hypothetical protein